MKKFLLVLSCCLATWCSVQAGPKSSPEISLMQASAPAPSKYPAVLSSAAYDKDNHKKVNVSFTAYQNGYVSFDLQGVQKAENLCVTSVSVGAETKGNDYNVSFTVPEYWDTSKDCAIVIKFNGSGCGGMKLPATDPIPPYPGDVQGYIEDVKLVGCDIAEDGWPNYISFKYNLTNASGHPYLYINEYGGENIAKISISNTNNYCYTISYNDHRKTMKENTKYEARLYTIDAQGKENDLGIERSFVMPKKQHYTYDFVCPWEPSINKYHIVLNKNIHPRVDKVQIWVEPINGGYPQYTDSGDPKKDYYFGMPEHCKGKYYVVRVKWSNGKVWTQTIRP